MRKKLKQLIEKLVIFLISRNGNKISCYKGVVIGIGKNDGLPEDAILIKFAGGDNRLFPQERLEKAGAHFSGAKVEYAIYSLGILSASTLRYVGPPPEELLKARPSFLTGEELAELAKS